MNIDIVGYFLLFQLYFTQAYLEEGIDNEDFKTRMNILEERMELMQQEKDVLDERMKEKDKKLDNLEARVAKLEELTKVSTLRSCDEYAAFGLATSGYYLIDPDGPLVGEQPIQVLCNFTSGATEVLHDTTTLTEVGHCHEPGCYEKEISYINGVAGDVIPLSQIDSLKQISEHCLQTFRYECTLAPLRADDVDYAFWTDRTGDKNVYFTGSNKGFHSCDCEFTDEGCYDEDQRGNTCNCDINLPAPLIDTGVITNTTALPVMKLAFGGLDFEIQSGAFQLGNLQCFGKKEVEVASSCSALKLAGATLSGYYNIKKPLSDRTSQVFCDMDGEGYEDVPEYPQPDSSSPLGTIAAWVSKPASEAEQASKIPPGWVMCNGSLIERGPWKGSLTPDLNSGGHFLRGGEPGQQLELEDDQVQDHQHQDPGHSHSASSSSQPHQHTYDEYHVNSSGSSGIHHYQPVSSGDRLYRGNYTSSSSEVSVSTTVSESSTGISGVTTTARAGAETRPRNMKISWIIRCW